MKKIKNFSFLDILACQPLYHIFALLFAIYICVSGEIGEGWVVGLIFGYVAGAVVSLLAGMALAIPFFILDALKDILIATYEAFSS